MKKLWILSIFVAAMVCLLAVGVSAVDITTTGLTIDGTEDAGTYKAGDGTLTVSFEGDVCKIALDNAQIDVGEYGEVVLFSMFDTVIEFTGENRLSGDDVYFNGKSLILRGADDATLSLPSVWRIWKAEEPFSVTIDGGRVDANAIVCYNETDGANGLTINKGTVSGLLIERDSEGEGFFERAVCRGDVVIEAGERVEFAPASLNDTTFAFETGASLTIDGELLITGGIEANALIAWLAGKPISGSGRFVLGVEAEDGIYTTKGEPIKLKLKGGDWESMSAPLWRWDSITKTLTLKDGFRCVDDIIVDTDGKITVALNGQANIGGDFLSDDDASVTITGDGTLTIDGRIKPCDSGDKLHLILDDAAAAVIVKNGVALRSLTLNDGTLAVSGSNAPLIDIKGGALTVSETAVLRVEKAGNSGDAAIRFSGVTSTDGLCSIPGTTLIESGEGTYILADKNGKPFVSYGVETEDDEDAPSVLLLLFMKRVLQEYTVTLTASEGGSITGDETVRWSRDAVYTITPDEGYTLAALYLDGEEVEPTLTLTLDRVKADRTIEAVFAPIEE